MFGTLHSELRWHPGTIAQLATRNRTTLFMCVSFVMCLCLVFSGCRSVATAPGPDALRLNDADDEFARALAHYALGLVYEREEGPSSPKVFDEFSRAAELDPGKHRLYAKVASAALHQDMPDRAISVLEKSCAENPNDVRARIHLAAACHLTGKVDLAVKHYMVAIKLSPENASLYVAAARLLLQQKQEKWAFKIIEDAIKVSPTKPSVYITAANLLFQHGQDKRAFAVIEDGMRKTGETEQLLSFCYTEGKDLIKAKQIDRAIACFEFLAGNRVERRPEFQHLVGELYHALGREEDAIRSFLRATEVEHPLRNSFVRLATMYLKTDSAKAVEILRKGTLRLPQDPVIAFMLGSIYSSEKRFDDAIAAFETTAKIVDKQGKGKLTSDFYLYYGAACERSGLLVKAEKIFEECIALYPRTHRVLNYLAYMWAERGMKLDKALTYVKQALECEPDNGAYVDTLGWIYYKQEKYGEALEQVQKANGLVGDDSTITDHLGDTFLALSETDKAITYWKQSFTIDPNNSVVAGKLGAHGVDIDVLRKAAEKERKKVAQKKKVGEETSPPEPVQ